VNRKQWFLRGMQAGIPIALGYFAVAITLGIAARNAGLTAAQATLSSFLLNASAGEYIGFTLMAAGAGYVEVMVMEAIANARYLLMSAALSQKLSSRAGTLQRLLVGFDVTDEVFGATISQQGKVDPFFCFGAMVLAIPGWSLGTLCGVLIGNILPARLVSALSVSLYGMFISVFVPEARKNKVVAVLVLISFALSLLLSVFPLFNRISEGVKIILLTVVISLAAALLFPVKEVPNER